ncbi:MAG: PorV/PorQ family protein [Ignavibacteria bacterium]|nr:PorV/PorQ family protein [Ignavibacteria bacterium]
MKFYIKIIIILLAVSLAYQNGYSGPRKKFGTLAAPELLIPIGSSGTSLGGSNLATVKGIDAMYWNPAGLAEINSSKGEVMFSSMNYIADINMNYFAGVVKLGGLGSIGASLRAMSFGEELVTTEYAPEGTGATFSPSYIVGTLSFAKAMTDKIHFGTNLKLISEQIADVSATGFAFDFGLQYVAGASGLRFGIALKNLGSSMKFNGPGLDRTFIENGLTTVRRVNLQEADLPTNLEIGLGYSTTFSKNNNVTLSSTFLNSSFSSDEYKFGMEYNYNQMVFLRGAFTVYPDNSEIDDVNKSLFGPSFGAGLKYPFGSLTLGFDYAYRVINETGFNSTNQYFTLNVGF